VGLVAVACLAKMGHTVKGLDVDVAKIEALQSGRVPFFEPDLDDLLAEVSERVSFHTSYADAVRDQDFIFICVNTPPDRYGRPRMHQITSAARSLAEEVRGNPIIVNKSTGPVGMADLITRVIAEHGNGKQYPVVSNPEFLRQSHGVYDFLHPHQVVVGSTDAVAARAVADLYKDLDTEVVVCDNPRAPEMTKLVSNAYRATKISFTNEVATICEQVDVDVTQVSKLLAADKAIGPAFLNAGVGWGGNCLPKDVLTLQHVARIKNVKPKMLQAVISVNNGQRKAVLEKLHELLGDLSNRTVGVLGLAFKGGTDDIRMSPAIEIAQMCLRERAHLRVFDPMAMPLASRVLKGDVSYCGDEYEAIVGADAVLVLTDWPQFQQLDLGRVRRLTAQPNLIDGRNIINPAAAEQAGLVYIGMGRSGRSKIGHSNVSI
jgi:UDPglucose 6-dehydrogenase